MTNILIWSILIIPWLILPFKDIPDSTRLIKACFYDVSMIGIIIFAIKDGLKFSYKNKYLAWMAGWILFTMLINWYWPLMFGYGYSLNSLEPNMHFLLTLCATVCVCSNFERIDFVKVSKAICFSATAVSIYAMFQVIGLDPMTHLGSYIEKETRHIVATLDHPDVLGNYLALSVPYFLYLGGLKYTFCLGLVLFIIFAAKSSLSIVAAVTGMFIFLIIKHRTNLFKKALISIGMICFSAFCIFTPAFSRIASGFSGRIDAWKTFLQRDDNYIFGHFLGIAKAYGVKFGNNFWTFCHNDYLEIFLALGFIGLFLFIILAVNTVRNFDFGVNNELGLAYFSSLAIFFILMIGSFPMEIAPVALGGVISFWGVEKIKGENHGH